MAKKSAAESEAHEMIVKQMQEAGAAALELACSQGLMRLLGAELSIPAHKAGEPPIPCMFSWTHSMLAMYQLAGQAIAAVRNNVIERAVKEARKKRDGQMLLGALDLRTTLWLGQHELARTLSLDNMMPAVEALNVLDGEMQAYVEQFREVAIVKSRWHQTWSQRAKAAKIENLPWWLQPGMVMQAAPPAVDPASTATEVDAAQSGPIPDGVLPCQDPTVHQSDDPAPPAADASPPASEETAG